MKEEKPWKYNKKKNSVDIKANKCPLKSQWGLIQILKKEIIQEN